MKRVLAYSSVENMGLITLGLGVGLLGRGTRGTRRSPRSASPARCSTSGTTP